MTRPSHDSLATAPGEGASGSFEGWVLYAPRNEWLALLAQGWVLPWIVDVDRSGYSVLLERDA